MDGNPGKIGNTPSYMQQTRYSAKIGEKLFQEKEEEEEEEGDWET